MCSISGIWNLNGKPVTPEVIDRFNDSLAHRGPDGGGHFIHPNDGPALGHRRLSIIDLSSAGRQPMSYGEHLKITFNGEIYNYIELRAELMSKGHRFQSHSDTEVILAAWLEWGEQCLLRFNGMWAFAIWDERTQSLFISRDRFGVKPLYYIYRPGQIFAFASESFAFGYLEGYSKEMDSRNVSLGIRDPFYLEGVGETIYTDMVKLKPGHSMLLRKGKPPVIRQWWKTEEHLMEVPDKYEDQVARFRELFQEACTLRLRSDVPVGIALSGGLDSSSVYCTIQEIYKQNLARNEQAHADWQNAFIATFPGTSMDEREFADEVVRYTGGKANYIFPQEGNICDFIYLSPPIVHTIYQEMRRNNVKVSLDGHGADEMLFGYGHMVAEWINSDDDADKEMLIKTWAQMKGIPLSAAKAQFAGRAPEQVASLAHQLYDMLIPDSVKKIYRRQAFNRRRSSSWLMNYAEFNPGWTSTQATNNPSYSIPYQKFHVDMLPALLRNWDRAAMQHGVEIRMPFMDWRLITYVFSLPGTAKVNDGFSKKIVRDAMKGWMPDSIRLRTHKIGVNAPMEEWFKGPMKSFILDIIHSDSFLKSSIWNGPVIAREIQRLSDQNAWTQGDCNTIWPYLNAWILQQNRPQKS
jgi:asparagine synthase (glutamine-hydrolysing)